VAVASAHTDAEHGAAAGRSDQSVRITPTLDNERKLQTPKSSRRSGSELAIVKDKVVCAFTDGLTKLSSLVFDLHHTPRRSRRCR